MRQSIDIYIADLAAYNCGQSHGIWIEATNDLKEIKAQIDAMLAQSPIKGAESYAIHDYQGFGRYAVGEYESITAVHKMACFIEEYPEFGADLLDYYIGDLESARNTAKNHYCGCYHSLAEYAQELIEDTTSLPDNISFYIDYEKMAWDMQAGSDVFAIETDLDEVHVFWNH